MIQAILKWILNVFGTVYVLIERWVEYPNEDHILGIYMDEDLRAMSRKELCEYMDTVLPEKGFYDLQSTTKIRLGCMLLRKREQYLDKLREEMKEISNKTPYTETDGLETGSPGDYDY